MYRVVHSWKRTVLPAQVSVVGQDVCRPARRSLRKREAMKTAPATPKGERTRAAITATAARLMHERGIGATALEEILTESGAGKSQLYYYFKDKQDLSAAVLRHQFASVLAAQQSLNDETCTDLMRWRSEVLAAHRASGFSNCPLGAFIGQVEDIPALRDVFADLFEQWRSAIAVLVNRARQAGRLPADVDPDEAGLLLLGALQGGTMLAHLQGRQEALERILDATLLHLGVHVAEVGRTDAGPVS